MITQFYNARILQDHDFIKGDLWVNNGTIIQAAPTAHKKVDLKGALLAPGYIDLQVNGGYGHDFTTEPASVPIVASKLPQTGVTSFLTTVVSTSSDKYKSLLDALRIAIHSSPETGSLPLGIHLEGPFINPKFAGAHTVKTLREFLGLNSLEEFYGSFEGVKLVTLAPELKEADSFIDELVKRNIVVSLGHSGADIKTVQSAFKNGAILITHLYNAMAPFYHREPGLIGAALSDINVNYTIIADNVHIHPAALKMAWNANKKGLILITDAISAQGMPKGRYTLGDQKIDISQGRSYVTGTKTLAGSTLTMNEAVRNLWSATGCSKAEAIEAASLKPARLLGLKHKGNLDAGSDADFIVLDDDLKVQSTYIAGKCVWQA